MKNAYIFDVWETLVDTPEWYELLKKDPELRALNEKAKTDVPSKRELVRRFDEAVQGGKLTIQPVPGAERVLDELVGEGHLVAFSSGSNYTNQALLNGADFRDYFNPLLIVSDADTLGRSKGEETAYVHLFAALDELDLKPKLFVDNTERNVATAAKLRRFSLTNPLIPLLYHFDRTASGLMVPEQKEGYVKIASLNQMRELQKTR